MVENVAKETYLTEIIVSWLIVGSKLYLFYTVPIDASLKDYPTRSAAKEYWKFEATVAGCNSCWLELDRPVRFRFILM